MFIQQTRPIKRHGTRRERRILELMNYARDMLEKEKRYSRAWVINHAIEQYKVSWHKAFEYALEVEKRLGANKMY